MTSPLRKLLQLIRKEECHIVTVCRWSAKAGPHPGGDPDLHHYVGELLYKGTSRVRSCAPVPALIGTLRTLHIGTQRVALTPQNHTCSPQESETALEYSPRRTSSGLVQKGLSARSHCAARYRKPSDLFYASAAPAVLLTFALCRADVQVFAEWQHSRRADFHYTFCLSADFSSTISALVSPTFANPDWKAGRWRAR